MIYILSQKEVRFYFVIIKKNSDILDICKIKISTEKTFGLFRHFVMTFRRHVSHKIFQDTHYLHIYIYRNS